MVLATTLTGVRAAIIATASWIMSPAFSDTMWQPFHRAPDEVQQLGGAHQRFGGHAPVIGAGAAEMVALREQNA
jgi:hypothetical protein